MTINKRYIEMERFLQFWVDVYRQNPGYEINHSNVYEKLIRLGVSEKDYYYDSSYNGNFDYWVKNFYGNKNTNVFVSDNWSYFCQFKNDRTNGTSLKEDLEHIKMYIPLDSEHIKNGSEMIFKFLSENNIMHLSKVGKAIRFDDVVIRLTSMEDALKLQKFIDENDYIQKGLLPPNPFAFNNNNIAYACDGRLSYNSTISQMIVIYFNERKNDLSKVGLQDFIDFIYKYYQDVFITKKDEHKCIEDFDLSDKEKTFGEIYLYIQNYKQIFELFIKTMHPDFKIQHLNNQFMSNKKERESLIRKISEMEQEKSEEYEISSIVLKGYYIMAAKYGNEFAKKNIIKYIETGEPIYLTRTGQVRETFLNLNVRLYLLKKAEQNMTTILETLNNIISVSHNNSANIRTY